MILVFGGTTEGRLAVEVLDEAGKEFYYSTKGALQEIAMKNGIRLNGAMTSEDIAEFCETKKITCIIDAAHPFAKGIHHAISEAAIKRNIYVIRLQRVFAELPSDIEKCGSYEEAIEKMERDGVERLLALSGANTMKPLKPFWTKHTAWFRILPRKESTDIAKSLGFPESNLLYYKYEDESCSEVKPSAMGCRIPTLSDEIALMKLISPDAVITKESGNNGGFSVKIEAARRLGIKVYVLTRPQTYTVADNADFRHSIVTGQHGLRREVERFAPGFFPLRTGFTTGSCAVAAAKAALNALAYGDILEQVDFALPDGEVLSMEVNSTVLTEKYAEAEVIKDAGDDPDVTNGCHVRVKVEYVETDEITDGVGKRIQFVGGEGIGTVTLPGLGLDIGEPAINVTPRRMIESELLRMTHRPLKVTISVPEGRELALKTFNHKVGVVGGISIIGTSGIVRPLSNEAFVESIKKQIEVAYALGCRHLVINSGAKSERIIKSCTSELLSQSYIHYGNFIGQTLNAIKEVYGDANLPNVTLGVMIGKAVKLAEGNLDTHSHKVAMNKDFLIEVAKEAGCSKHAIDSITGISMARELWDVLSCTDSTLFFSLLKLKCLEVCAQIYPYEQLQLLLISEDGKIV